MPTTSYVDPTFHVLALQSRTDEAGAAVTDVNGPELRLPWSLYTEGVVGADSWQVVEDSPTGMGVVLGSGSAFVDLAIVSGDTAGQGNYGVLLDAATVDLTVPAADLSNPRIDQVWLAIIDDPGTMVKARIGYRQGDAASSPSAPGPDSGWEGSLLLASIAVAAGETAIVDADITDERVAAQPVVGAEIDGATEVASATLTGSLANVATVTLDIPTYWTSWKCVADATYSYQTGAPPATHEVVISIDGTDQQLLASIDSTDTGATDVGAVGGRRVGMTTTGSRTVALRARETLGDVALADIYLYACAKRIS
jgi:hypothetical protein